jgi:D-glycero-D-manno-heptose 1,7-bisphosphate phosphatase
VSKNGAWGVFLDRDGVLNDVVVDAASGLPESPYRPEDVRLLEGAAEAVQLLARCGAAIGVISNQPAAAKGTHTRADLEAVHTAVEQQLSQAAAPVAVWCYCLHHPGGTDPELGRACDCRKPATGLIVQAATALGVDDLKASWVVGDSDVDIEAGHAAGCRTVLVETAATAHRRSRGLIADHRAAGVLDAARIIALATAQTGRAA